MSEPVRAGVVGVGSMGQNHARVYDDLENATLVGVADADRERAESVADDLGTTAVDLDALLADVEVVSIAVPTQYHYDLAVDALDAGVDVLVEKPFVADPARGRDLIERAEANDATLQVGHVERFNPVVEAVERIVSDLDVIAADAERLTPPPDREIEDTATMDLMTHDIDLVQTLLDGTIESWDSFGTESGRYAVGNLQFDTGVVASLTASRVTQESVRQLTVSAASCRVKADLLDQTVEVHREGSADLDGVECRSEDVVEQFTVEDGEPLERELRSFVEAARTNAEPRVTGEDGLRVLEVAQAIEREHTDEAADRAEPTTR